MQEIGKIIHYFKNINVAVIALADSLKVGDKIRIKGIETDFEQPVDSIQIDKNPIQEGKKGQEIAIKVTDKVRDNDVIYKI